MQRLGARVRLVAVLAVALLFAVDWPAAVALEYAADPTALLWWQKAALMLAVVLVFLGIMASCLQLGLMIATLLRVGLHGAEAVVVGFALGFIALSWVVMGLGHTGWMSPPLARFGISSLLLLGWLVDGSGRPAAEGWRRPASQLELGGALRVTRTQLRAGRQLFAAEPVAVLLIGLFLSSACAVALAPQTHGDPLYYHVKIAWLWAEAGRIDHVDWLPMALQAGLVEYLYSLAALLVRERLSLLVVCQLLSVAFGLVLPALAAYCIARRLEAARWLALLCALASVTVPQELLSLTLAKNDGFVFFFALCGMLALLIYFDTAMRRHFYLAMGVSFTAVAVKLTGIFFLLPVSIAALLVRSRSLLQVGVRRELVAGLALTVPLALPILLRNAAFVGNPVYPWFDEYFPASTMHDYVREHIAGRLSQSGTALEVVLAQAQRWLVAKPVLLLAPLLVLSRSLAARFVAATYLLAVLFQGLATGMGLHARFAFFIYGLGAISGVLVCGEIGRRVARSPLQHRAFKLIVLLVALLYGDYRAPLMEAARRSLPFVGSRDSFASYFSRQKPRYAVDIWINQNVEAGFIYGVWDNQSLFLDLPQSVAENHDGAAAVHRAKDYREALARFDEAGFTHILMPHGLTHRLSTIFDGRDMERDFQRIRTIHGYSLYARLR